MTATHPDWDTTDATRARLYYYDDVPWAPPAWTLETSRPDRDGDYIVVGRADLATVTSNVRDGTLIEEAERLLGAGWQWVDARDGVTVWEHPGNRLAAAVARLRNADPADLVDYERIAFGDGDPWECPPQGRVFVDRDTDMVSIDLPTGIDARDPDATGDPVANHQLGVVPGLYAELAAAVAAVDD